jgi:ABC-type transport system involved in cytochrome c biogenesis permease subunit
LAASEEGLLSMKLVAQFCSQTLPLFVYRLVDTYSEYINAFSSLLIHAGFSLVLFFDPEEGGVMILV